MAQRLVSGEAQPEDLDLSVRPRWLADFVGQQQVKENLSIGIQAAKMRGEALGHVMIYGPPGLGKTTLANIIAHELGANIKVTSGPAIQKAGDVAVLLTGLQAGDVLFIDEIHRLMPVAEELLYPAMEDFFMSWMKGKGQGRSSVNLRIDPFTLVGATTRYSLVSPPLRDRFGSVFRLGHYDLTDTEEILRRAAAILEVGATTDGIRQLAARSRGTPRIANRLLRWTRDFALVKADNRITGAVARQALNALQVDDLGLDQLDHRLLSNIIGMFDGGPVGLETLAASLNEDSDTVMEVWEPYLLQLGFLDRTPRGRMATRRAYEYLGRAYPVSEPSGQGRMTGL